MNWKKLTNGEGAVFELTDGYWTNGQVVIKGMLPVRLRNLKGVEVIKLDGKLASLASLIPKGHAMEAATSIAESDEHVLLTTGDLSVRIDSFFHGVLRKYIGSFTYMLHDNKSIVLCVNGAGIAGAVMPIYRGPGQ